MNGLPYTTAQSQRTNRRPGSSSESHADSSRPRGWGDGLDLEGRHGRNGSSSSGTVPSSSNRAGRDFPPTSQIPLPPLYQRYQQAGQHQQQQQQIHPHHQYYTSSNPMQPPSTTMPVNASLSQQQQRVTSDPSYPTYGDRNQYGTTQPTQQSQGYPETVQSTSSPVTAHRYDYGFGQIHPAGISADQAQDAQSTSQIDLGFYPRRRESMPDLATNNEPGSGTGGSHYQGDYDPRFSHYAPPPPTTTATGISHHHLQKQQDRLQPAAQQQNLRSASAAALRGWHTAQSIPQHQQQQSASIPVASVVPPLDQRSRGSTLGSRTTDDEMLGGTGTGTDEGNASRQSSPAVREGTVSMQTIAPSSNVHISSVKREMEDELMDVEEEGEGEGDAKIDHRKRKRNRTIRSCVPCHNHKRKCDRKRPCGRCTALGLTGTCVYEIDEARDLNDPEVAETDRLRRRIAELEQVVRELRQRTPARGVQTSNVPTAPVPRQIEIIIDDPAGEDGKKRSVIVDRFARFKLDEAKHAENQAAAAASGTGTPDLTTWTPNKMIFQKSLAELESRHSSGGHTDDVAVGGPSTSTDARHQGGTVLSKDYTAEPYSAHLLPGEEMVADRSGMKTFLGALAGKSMLRRLRELASTKNDGGLLTVPEDVAFTGVFPDIRKTFPFTTIWSHDNFSAEIIGLLPNQQQSELLWDAWIGDYAAHFAPFHMPTLHAEFAKFFEMSTQDKMNVPLSSLAVFLMVCALGCLMRATSAEIFGHANREVAAQAKTTGATLRDPKDLTTSRLQSELYLHTLQCQLLVEVYLLVSERAADAWSIDGSIVKQAIALGLHKDPLSLDPKISMRDAEIKRRLWWSIAGFDCMLCIFFGRPSGINYYTTNLPQDRPDENLSDAPGSAQQYLPPSNVLSNKTTDQTYHAAYYQLTIPSFELLQRIFHTDRKFSRSAIYGWFSPPPDNRPPGLSSAETTHNTYQDAIGLAKDISQWYSHLPDGMRCDVDDTAEFLIASRTRRQGNQSLGLCIKTWTLVMVLHRPYLRLDPAAYPESTAICTQAAHMILRAYNLMVETKSTLAWSFWTMSYRAFQAGAVCAFLAIREPGTELAAKCLEDLRGAIAIFEDRLSTWNTTHPVQADLCEGLLQLEKLVTAATQQRNLPLQPFNNASQSCTGSSTGGDQTLFSLSPNFSIENGQSFNGTPRSQIQAFPPMSPSIGGGGALGMFPTGSFSSGEGGDDGRSMSGLQMGTGTGTSSAGNGNGNGNGTGSSSSLNDMLPFTTGTYPIQPAEHLSGTFSGDFNGPDPLALPQVWASMFGIRMDKDVKETTSSGGGPWV
ncbi:hypothetical protein CI109_101637 [Kwoniella shandongensis]|uniref:Zn(2)-C6 fungal-type domain-containing protein n=1 Tax=Kwoniella shandongensis TaxID=1734106 RepID=A0AAJ8LI53_9TREE